MPKNKTCKHFCEKIFLPERENIEIMFNKKMNRKMSTPTKSFARTLKKIYIKSCDDIYCQKKCKNNKKWLTTFTKKRKNKLTKQGAKSGCRDLIKEYPGYYKNL